MTLPPAWGRHCRKLAGEGSKLLMTVLLSALRANTRGRRLTVTRALLTTPPKLADGPEIVVQSQEKLKQTLGPEALIWIDLPATAFRRHLKSNLERQKLEIQPGGAQATSISSAQKLLTRHQRAHRRLSWNQRLNRNRLKGRQTIYWKVQLFGISPSLAQFLKRTHVNTSEPL